MPIWNPSTGRVDGDALSAAIVSVDSHANTASAAATSVDGRVTSVNAFLASISALSVGGTSVKGLQSVVNALSNRISAGGGGGVTTAEMASAIGVETSNRVSADNVLSAAIAAADGHADTASAAATSAVGLANAADAHASTASLAATSVDGRATSIEAKVSALSAIVISGIASVDARVTSVNSRLDNVSALSVGVSKAGLQSAVNALSNTISNQGSIRAAADTSLDGRATSINADLVSQKLKIAINADNQASITVSTGITVSGVSITLSANQAYCFRFVIPFTCRLPSGILVQLTGPAMTTFAARHQIPGSVGNAQVLPAANGVAPFFAQVNAIATKVSTTSITLTATTLVAYAEGCCKPSANGSLKFVIGPNVSAGANSGVIVLQGANLQVWRIQ